MKGMTYFAHAVPHVIIGSLALLSLFAVYLWSTAFWPYLVVGVLWVAGHCSVMIGRDFCDTLNQINNSRGGYTGDWGDDNIPW